MEKIRPECRSTFCDTTSNNTLNLMRFTQIPTQHTPLGGKVVYAFDTETAEGTTPLPNTQIRITNAMDGTSLGAKRFVAVATAAFDAAPYLHRAVCFVPTVGGSGFYDAGMRGRTITARMEATTTAEVDGSVTTTPERTFLPCAKVVEAPAILTSMPLARLIAPGECDELTLLTDTAHTVVVTAEIAGGLVAQSYGTAQGGLHLLRLDTRDFAGARTITVDAGACGTVAYTLLTAPEGARRLAWRSEAGAIEHYTFPRERSETLAVTKTHAESPEGQMQLITKSERRIVLTSAYESRAVLDGLAGIICAKQVWEIIPDGYIPVEVMNSEVVIHRHGALSLLEIEIRSIRKTPRSWN